MIVPVAADTTAETATIYLNETPWAPGNDDLTASRLGIVEAHRQILNILYHQPPTLPTEDSKSALTLITNIINTADEYCALPAVSWYMENHLVRHFETETVTLCIEKPRLALQLALKARSGWMFREVAGRLIGAPSFDDAEIKAQFEDLGVVPWLLAKRTQLRAMIQEIDIELLTLDIEGVFGSSDIYIKVAVAVFRALIVGYYRENRCEGNHMRRRKWATYARLYRVIGHCDACLSHTDIMTLLDESGLADHLSKPLCVSTFRVLLRRAAQAVAPLLNKTLSHDANKRIPLTAGFTCVRISDEDLPWKSTTPW